VEKDAADRPSVARALLLYHLYVTRTSCKGLRQQASYARLPEREDHRKLHRRIVESSPRYLEHIVFTDREREEGREREKERCISCGNVWLEATSRTHNAFACIKVSVYLASAKYNNLTIFMRHRGEAKNSSASSSFRAKITHKLCTSQMHLLTSMRSVFINTLHNYAKHIVFDSISTIYNVSN